MARRWRDVSRCAASCSASRRVVLASLGVFVGASKTLGGRAGCKIQRTFFGSSTRLRINRETLRLLTREAGARPAGADIPKLAAPLCLRGDIATMVSTLARCGFSGRRELRRTLRGPPVACALRHMLALAGFGPRAAAERVWSTPLLKGTPRVGAAPPEAWRLPTHTTRAAAAARLFEKNSTFSPTSRRRPASASPTPSSRSSTASSSRRRVM